MFNLETAALIRYFGILTLIILERMDEFIYNDYIYGFIGFQL